MRKARILFYCSYSSSRVLLFKNKTLSFYR